MYCSLCYRTATLVVFIEYNIVLCFLYRVGDHFRSWNDIKLSGNERYSSRPFQRMSKLSQRIISHEVAAVLC